MSNLSPLNDCHIALGALMTDFAGWSMPVSYQGLVDEHLAVREKVGIFDVSHLGKLWLSGENCLAELNKLLSNDLAKIADGKAQYQLACNDAGGVVDDLIVYRFNSDRALLMPNAANAQEVQEKLRADLPDEIEMRVGDEAVIAVQGPNSQALLQLLGLPTPGEYMSFAQASWQGKDLLVCRSGYTGELGFELVANREICVALWQELLARGKELGAVPAGLGARDTLRTEMAYPLHGHELLPTRSALGSGANWAIAWDKPEFWGRETLLAAKADGPTHRLMAFKAEGRQVPRPGMPVLDKEQKVIGEITSGTFSPSLRCGIALALVEVAAGIKFGDEVLVQNRRRFDAFTRVKPPFISPKVQ